MPAKSAVMESRDDPLLNVCASSQLDPATKANDALVERESLLRVFFDSQLFQQSHGLRVVVIATDHILEPSRQARGNYS